MVRLLITITTTAEQADDLTHLLHKHPDSVFEREVGVGIARVFYPEVGPSRTTCALLLEIDPVGLVRGRQGEAGIDQYVNDRPFVAGSMMAVALKRSFASAMGGRAKDKLERLDEQWPLEVRVEALSCAGGPEALRSAFEPLGYEVELTEYPLDDTFPEWGASHVMSLTIRGSQTIRACLNHLYVLLPALDSSKHYWVGEEEVDKLVREAGEWLAGHPARDALVRGYLSGVRSLARDAVARLADSLSTDAAQEECGPGDRLPRLDEVRLERVLQVLEEAEGVSSAIDLGCGEGRLLALLRKSRRFTRIAGMDVSCGALAAASRRLGMDRWCAEERERLSVFQGSLLYADPRIRGYDAAALVEVLEHVDPGRLAVLERVVFEYARPRLVVVTTPNRDYNASWDGLASGALRHRDHRFEWSREEFGAWCRAVSERFGYACALEGAGPERPDLGCPTQMAVLRLGGETP